MIKPGPRVLRDLLCRWNWAKTGSVVINASVAAFIFASLLSSWSLAQAQEAQPRRPRRKRKQKAKNPPQNLTVPGAGTKVDAIQLAKIIDQEVNRRLAAEKIPAFCQIGRCRVSSPGLSGPGRRDSAGR